MGASASGPKPVYNAECPLAYGSDKVVYMGTFEGMPAAICIAKQQGRDRLQKDISILKQLGPHPNIVSMLGGQVGRQEAWLALEAVEPIGFDLDRLVKQYIFAKQNVPASLTQRMIDQLASALMLMHSCKLVHRDVKTENVLVTKDYEAKLIDMGIATPVGSIEDRWVGSPKSYMAPETCQGNRPQGPEVDCWGLGVVLHQMYQHRWDIVDASRNVVVMRPQRPSLQEPMADHLKEAMVNLLQLEPARRWTLKQTQASMASESSPGGEGSRTGWHAPIAEKSESRKNLSKYKPLENAPPLTAFAAVVDSKHGKHLIGKKVHELHFRTQHGAILLLIDVPHDSKLGRQRHVERSPGMNTVIEDGAWLYFGFPPSEDTDSQVASLKAALFPQMAADTVGRSCDATAGLMAFALEFDCFVFPHHIGSAATIGPADASGMVKSTALNLRGHFGLNLAGIVRKTSGEPEWFPGPTATVEPGDLGLVVRCPCQNGSTEPLVFDNDLGILLDASKFEQRRRAK